MNSVTDSYRKILIKVRNIKGAGRDRALQEKLPLKVILTLEYVVKYTKQQRVSMQVLVEFQNIFIGSE